MKLLIVEPGGPSGTDAALGAALGGGAVPVLVTRAGSTAEGQALLRTDPQVDHLVLALGLPAAAAIEAIPDWLSAAPAASLVATSANADRATVMAAIRAGAASFVECRGRPGELVAPLRTVVDGGLWLPPAILERRAPDRPGYGTWLPAPRSPDDAGLTRGQAAVLRGFVAARSTPRIAAETGLTEAEVAAHLAALFQRFDASARLPMVLAVARLGLRLGG